MKITVLTTQLHDIDNLLIRDVPVTSTIVEIDDHNLTIIDTGMFGNPDLVEQLTDLGYIPSDFTLVLNTHLHPDHVGGNQLFNNARILFSRTELEYEINFAKQLQENDDPVATLRCMGRQVGENNFHLAYELKKLAEKYPASDLVSEQVEFIEDEPTLPVNISIMPVPGHSIDSRAVILQDEDRAALVAGDALFHRDMWRKNSIGILHDDIELFMRSAQQISGFQGIIIPGHDQAFDNTTHRYLEDDTFFL
jgi:N-acyl homoserine lactone hydrolase